MHDIIFVAAGLGAGLFAGSRFQGARDAHERFTRYRKNTNTSLASWLKTAFAAGLASVLLGLMLLLVVVVLLLH